MTHVTMSHMLYHMIKGSNYSLLSTWVLARGSHEAFEISLIEVIYIQER